MSYLCPSCGNILEIGVNYKRGRCVRCELTVDLRCVSTPFKVKEYDKKEAGLLEEGAGVYNPDDPFLQRLDIAMEKLEKENDMKKVYEFVVYNQEGILWEGKVLAKNGDQARLLIPNEIGSSAGIDFSAENVEVRIRPFC